MVDEPEFANQITVGDFTFFNGGAFPSNAAAFEKSISPLGVGSSARLACDYKIETNGVKNIDLLDGVLDKWSPSDQRTRGTCTAFAVVACMELLHLRKGNKIDFSTQFLYWSMREKYPEPSVPYWEQGATRAGQALKVVEEFGCCTKESLDYPFELDPANISGPAPDEKAFNEATKYKARNVDYYFRDLDGKIPNLADTIVKHLESGRPVAVGLPMYRITDVVYPDGFTNKVTLRTGVVKGPPSVCDLDPNMAAEMVSAHQVCVVGFQLDSNAPGGGWFIFKNSWGYAFATSPKAEFDTQSNANLPFVPGTGYGAISAGYLNEYCWEYLCIDLV